MSTLPRDEVSRQPPVPWILGQLPTQTLQISASAHPGEGVGTGPERGGTGHGYAAQGDPSGRARRAGSGTRRATWARCTRGSYPASSWTRGWKARCAWSPSTTAWWCASPSSRSTTPAGAWPGRRPAAGPRTTTRRSEVFSRRPRLPGASGTIDLLPHDLSAAIGAMQDRWARRNQADVPGRPVPEADRAARTRAQAGEPGTYAGPTCKRGPLVHGEQREGERRCWRVRPREIEPRRRIGEPLHHAERVQPPPRRGIARRTRPPRARRRSRPTIDGELHHGAAVLVRIELPGGIALARRRRCTFCVHTRATVSFTRLRKPRT